MVTKKIPFVEAMRGVKYAESSRIYCQGSLSIMAILPEYKDIKPIYMGSCRECELELKPINPGTNNILVAPKHYPRPRKFTFTTKYNDWCDSGWHPIKAGTKARYLGVRISCKEHM